jgi:phosphonate transport system substrate-binding protein
MAVAFVLLLMFSGCDKGPEYQPVDFSKTIEAALPPPVDPKPPVLRVAVAAMISPRETFIYYRELIDYLCGRLGCRSELIQRKTYGEINQLLAQGRIDLAFICTGPYVEGKAKHGFEAIATPIVRGEPFYRAYLIVHRDSQANSLAELEGKTFAFTDPESNTGALVPHFWLAAMGRTPEGFFKSFTYTFSHDNSIMAVAKKLVDAAAVDSHIWEFYQLRNDYYSAQTRVIRKSDPFGSPPLVVPRGIDGRLKTSLSDLVLTLHQDPEGRRILNQLLIDHFVPPQDQWYAPAMNPMTRSDSNAGTQHVSQKP